MEIKYKNSLEDIEFLLNYFSSKFIKGSKIFKYIVISIPFFSGIYYSIIKNNILYFFTNSIVMNIIFIYIMVKLEPNLKKNICKKQANKMFNNEKYFSEEKVLIISDESIIIKCDEGRIEIKLNKSVLLDVFEDYILIISKKGVGYKNKLIIPSNAFKSELEKKDFIEKIKLKIND